MKERPDFPLSGRRMCSRSPHADAPLAVFDRRYSDMSLEAKVAYSLPTASSSPAGMAGSMSGEKSLSFFHVRSWPRSWVRTAGDGGLRTLVERKLIWEKRCGRGDANQIYLASVSPVDDPDYASAPSCRKTTAAIRN